MVESISRTLLTELGIQTEDAECKLMGDKCKLLKPGYRYHKLRKTYFLNNYDFISFFHVGLSRQGQREQEFYGEIVVVVVDSNRQCYTAKEPCLLYCS